MIPHSDVDRDDEQREPMPLVQPLPLPAPMPLPDAPLWPTTPISPDDLGRITREQFERARRGR